ncbi:MAG: hypothetical protein Q4F00_02375 [bacterium]|nr:hypothetical protein [bacterium]
MNRERGLKYWAYSLTALAVIGVSLNLSGCKQKPLVTATIDTTKLLQNDDGYQKLAQQYYNARIDLASKLQKETGGVIKDQATYDKYAKAEADLNAEWLQITRDFTEKKMVDVRKVCDKLHETKGIDLVVLDSAWQPTVEYGAVDVTADVLAELSGFASDAKGTDEKEKNSSADSGKNDGGAANSAVKK